MQCHQTLFFAVIFSGLPASIQHRSHSGPFQEFSGAAAVSPCVGFPSCALLHFYIEAPRAPFLRSSEVMQLPAVCGSSAHPGGAADGSAAEKCSVIPSPVWAVISLRAGVAAPPQDVCCRASLGTGSAFRLPVVVFLFPFLPSWGPAAAPHPPCAAPHPPCAFLLSMGSLQSMKTGT